MRVALVHDYLNQLGGGERVLDELIRMFPEAKVYTLMYDEAKTLGRYKGRIAGTSFLDFQFARDHHRLFIPLMPLAAKNIRIPDDVDLIISDTAGFAKGVSYDRTRTKHISYIHTPLRYAWETENYFDNSPQNLALKILAAPLFAYVRHTDYETGQRPEVLVANSKYIAGKVKQYYGRDAAVVYPPVDGSRFYRDSTDNRQPKTNNYYLAVGRLLHYKRFDLIIDAFLELDVPLKIVGDGPEYDSLKARAARTSKIEFLGFVKDDTELRRLYQGAKAFVMANDEDFGLVMAEAQSCGTPVVAYGAGGALEIIEQGKSGVFFNEQNTESLVHAIRQAERSAFDCRDIAERAQRFSLAEFKAGIERAIAGLSKRV